MDDGMTHEAGNEKTPPRNYLDIPLSQLVSLTQFDYHAIYPRGTDNVAAIAKIRDKHGTVH